MEIKRNGSQPSSKGPADWFTGTVRIDSPFPNHESKLQKTDPELVELFHWRPTRGKFVA